MYACFMHAEMQQHINNCKMCAFGSFETSNMMPAKASDHVTKVRYYWLGVWYDLISPQVPNGARSSRSMACPLLNCTHELHQLHTFTSHANFNVYHVACFCTLTLNTLHLDTQLNPTLNKRSLRWSVLWSVMNTKPERKCWRWWANVNH